jgi:hypothetical protein
MKGRGGRESGRESDSKRRRKPGPQVTLAFGVDSSPADPGLLVALKSGKQRWPDSAATLRVQSFACEIRRDRR